MANVRSKLGNRIYLPDQFGNTVIPPDADEWRQCHTCGSIYARYEVKHEGRLTDFAEVLENPFDFRSGSITAIGEIRKFDNTGKRQHKRKVKQDLSDIKDPELRREIAKGARLISFEEK